MTEPRRVRTKDRPEVMEVIARAAERIVQRREALGMSRNQLSIKSGLSTHVMWRIENAEGDVQVGTLFVIAQALGLKLEDLLIP